MYGTRPIQQLHPRIRVFHMLNHVGWLIEKKIMQFADQPIVRCNWVILDKYDTFSCDSLQLFYNRRVVWDMMQNEHGDNDVKRVVRVRKNVTVVYVRVFTSFENIHACRRVAISQKC